MRRLTCLDDGFWLVQEVLGADVPYMRAAESEAYGSCLSPGAYTYMLYPSRWHYSHYDRSERSDWLSEGAGLPCFGAWGHLGSEDTFELIGMGVLLQTVQATCA